jgi:ribosomal protein L11
MAEKQTISSLVTGGQASAGPPLGPALGPMANGSKHYGSYQCH